MFIMLNFLSIAHICNSSINYCHLHLIKFSVISSIIETLILTATEFIHVDPSNQFSTRYC